MLTKQGVLRYNVLCALLQKREEGVKMNEKPTKIYVILSQTGTMLSRIIKKRTKAEYCHSSLGLIPDLSEMYSFGRRFPRNAFIGTFVKESPHYGTFKRFKDTDALVLEIEVGEEKYAEIYDYVMKMWSEKKKYHYNYLGLYLAAVKVARKKKNCFYCSEFVAHVLTECGVVDKNFFKPIIEPIDFFGVPHREIYRGKLREYSLDKIKSNRITEKILFHIMKISDKSRYLI